MAILNIIPYDKVKSALAQEKDTLREQREYNTTIHTRQEVEAVLPRVKHWEPEAQPWIPLEPWLDLIMSLRGLKTSDVHLIQLPPTTLLHLIHASSVDLQLGRVSTSDVEDLEASFPTTTTRGDFLENLIHHNKFFVRLHACSLKDSLKGKGPVKSISDLWFRLATSARGMRGLTDLRKALMPIYMYLFPWDECMRTEFEYRVYCAPSSGRISAISQYRWHSPWIHSDAGVGKREEIAQRLIENCEQLYQRIMAHSAMTDGLKARGFVFDVVEDPADQSVRLIELNDFGALSGCGACLFHWIRDAELLYGPEEDIELRVTIP